MSDTLPARAVSALLPARRSMAAPAPRLPARLGSWCRTRWVHALNHWTALCRPLENGMLGIDNGDVERAMRGPAMGRKNWFFAGSDEGAERAAILCTVLELAARHGLDLGHYLRDVMLKLASG